MQGAWSCTAILFLTWALNGSQWSAEFCHPFPLHPTTLNPGKEKGAGWAAPKPIQMLKKKQNCSLKLLFNHHSTNWHGC